MAWLNNLREGLLWTLLLAGSLIVGLAWARGSAPQRRLARLNDRSLSHS